MLYELEEINRRIATRPKNFVEEFESRFNHAIEDRADQIAKDHAYKIVMVSGPSASGKTTTTLKLERYLEERGLEAHTISLDDFFLPRKEAPKKEDGSNDYETVYSLNLELLENCCAMLVRGEKTPMPKYDFLTGLSNLSAYELQLRENEVVLMEGIHALNDIVTQHLPQDRLMKLYVSVSSGIADCDGHLILRKRQLRLLRRLVRDYRYRGSSAANTFSMWEDVVKGEEQYVLPFKRQADYTLDTTFPFDPCVLKPQAMPLLREAAEDPLWKHRAEELLCALEKVEEADRELLPKTSILREFVGGSIYHEERDKALTRTE